MCEIHREFELLIWVESLKFGITEGRSITAAQTLSNSDGSQNKGKGEKDHAIMGRIVGRTTTAQE